MASHRINSPVSTPLVFLLACLATPATVARGDAGAIRAMKRDATCQVTAFTDPTPLRAGPVDVSVFIQEAETGQPILGNLDPAAPSEGEVSGTSRDGLLVDIEVAPRGLPAKAMRLEATSTAASNKLFRAANFNLPHAGWWTFTVSLRKPSGGLQLQFDLEAAEPLPSWRTLWLWFCWPFFVIALFAISFLSRRTSYRDRRIARSLGPRAVLGRVPKVVKFADVTGDHERAALRRRALTLGIRSC